MPNDPLKDFVSRFPRTKAVLAHGYYFREAWAKQFGSAGSDGTSPAFFTTQKCASTFIADALKIVERHYGMRQYNYASLYWAIGRVNIPQHIAAASERLFGHADAIYGPLRDYVELPNMAARPLVLMLRDPRDVLLSAYYSVAFSHALPGGKEARAEFTAKRQLAKDLGPDGFVRFSCAEYAPKYLDYASKLAGRPNLTFIPYELLISKPRTWSERFLAGLGVDVKPEAVDDVVQLYEKGKPTGGQDAKMRHRRSGAAGQYKGALEEETIAYVEQEMKAAFDAFGCWPR